jgi:hypothetical protein
VAQQVVLHVGVMKSGTSYLQRLLADNREPLSARGVLFPGRSWAAQVRGVNEVLERKRVAVPIRPGSWQALVDELADWPGTGVISMEYLAPAARPKIDAVVASFASDAVVQVVVTARDLGRTVPAMWQESLKNGRDHSLKSYLAAIANDMQAGRRFWREQDVAGVCRRWGEAVGNDQVTVVTLPPAGAPAGELWQRFATAVGVDPSGVTMPGPANESLDAASAALLRRLNASLADLDFADYAPLVKHQLAKRILGSWGAEEPSVGFEPPPWLLERSSVVVHDLRESGVRLIGSWSDLEPQRVSGVDPDVVPVEEQLTVALRALEGLIRLRIGQGETK